MEKIKKPNFVGILVVLAVIVSMVVSIPTSIASTANTNTNTNEKFVKSVSAEELTNKIIAETKANIQKSYNNIIIPKQAIRNCPVKQGGTSKQGKNFYIQYPHTGEGQEIDKVAIYPENMSPSQWDENITPVAIYPENMSPSIYGDDSGNDSVNFSDLLNIAQSDVLVPIEYNISNISSNPTDNTSNETLTESTIEDLQQKATSLYEEFIQFLNLKSTVSENMTTTTDEEQATGS